MQNTRPLVIYHADCADGFSAAWCFWHKYGHDADYLAAAYRDNPPDVTGRDVYLVDFSYKPDVVKVMLGQAECLTLIDHHKTAIDDLQPIKESFVTASYAGYKDNFGWYCDLERSGATLAWDYLFPELDRPPLLEHIEDRDLWRFKLTHTREISAFVFAHEFDFQQWDKLMSADQAELNKMASIGFVLDKKHQKDVRELVKLYKRPMVIGKHCVWVAGLPKIMASDAGTLMAKGEPFAACYFDDAEYREFSLRSAEDGLDVSVIAKQFGGGGHAHAAGFKVPRDHPLATG